MRRWLAPLAAAGLLFVAAPAPAEQVNCAAVKDSAAKGDAKAEYLYAQSLRDGSCGKKDHSEAARWYRKAAQQGGMLAQYELAQAYFAGDGVPVDYVQAKKWYLKAAAQGHGPSELRLGFLYAEKHFMPLKPDYNEAEKWFRKAAEQNAGDAQFRMGNFYINYKHPPDYAQGIPWLAKASEGGNRTAMFDLGRIYLEGTGTAKDVDKGIGWIKKSAEADMLQAQMTLATVYADGKLVPKNPEESLKWTLKIADAPTAALFYLNRAGDIYFDGWDKIPRDYARARQFYERAALKGDRHARERMARIYKDGLGVPQDEEKAASYEDKIKK